MPPRPDPRPVRMPRIELHGPGHMKVPVKRLARQVLRVPATERKLVGLEDTRRSHQASTSDTPSAPQGLAARPLPDVSSEWVAARAQNHPNSKPSSRSPWNTNSPHQSPARINGNR